MKDKVRRREDILRAARVVFATKGYHDAKVDDIAAAANVAKGTFYLYFRDKRSILDEVMNRILVLLQGAVLKVDPRAEIAPQVKHNIRGVVGLFLDDPTLPPLLLSPLAGVDPEHQERLDVFFDNLRSVLEASLTEGQSLGIVAPGDAHLYACFALGALKEILREAPETRRSREEIVNVLFQMLCVGFLRVEGPANPAQ
jgi:AcrR family transcriptional regulator